MQPITVKELSNYIRQSVDELFPEGVWLVAEIISFQEHVASGHAYFELGEKDTDNQVAARVRANCWRLNYARIKNQFKNEAGIELQKGLKIMVFCFVQYHDLYGLSLTIEEIDTTYTLGEISRKKTEIIARLEAEGLLNKNKSLPMPVVLQRIAVISSMQAAGLEDFVKQLEQNIGGVSFRLKLFPAIMQGIETEKSVVSALHKIFDEAEHFDAIVMVRGGGAETDLHWFNSYEIGATIANSPLPVLTGIGHERNETVADVVAFLKFKTPTAAAQFCVQSAIQFMNFLKASADCINKAAMKMIADGRFELQTIENNFKQSVVQVMFAFRQKMLQTELKMAFSARHVLRENVRKLEALSQKWQLLDPKLILRRGYTITVNDGSIVRSAAHLKVAEKITTYFHDGELTSVIDGVLSRND